MITNAPAFVVPLVSGWLICLAQPGASLAAEYEPAHLTPPKISREFRGAWIATVNNIDWPSQKGLPAEQQKSEFTALLDRAVELKLNVIVFQVRPSCDALYQSSLEPWSEYLTGRMGEAPAPLYDPLAFAIEEAHRRGLELHAWFNPYRARHNGAKSPVAPNHISKTHPELVRQYGKSLWLDPGEKAVQDYSLSVVKDVVTRYDVDGVHFDDYFYPYKETNSAGQELDFPDQASWEKYGIKSRMPRDAWRRENVNTFIERVYGQLKSMKPWVKFGVSPFGIWRPGNPPSVKGFDAYAELYADSRKWLEKGWVDYFAPQLYWAIDAPEQSFPQLLHWWSVHNTHSRLLVAGMDTSKTGHRWPASEIINQIKETRAEPRISGHIHWSMHSLIQNPKLDEALETETYSEPALVPAAPWLGKSTLARPQLKIAAGSTVVSWSAATTEQVCQWVLQYKQADKWRLKIFPARTQSITFKSDPPAALAVTAIDRFGNASPPAVVQKRLP